MSAAVRELIATARAAAIIIEGRCSAVATMLRQAADEATAELNKSPAEQHQERLEEVLQWNR